METVIISVVATAISLISLVLCAVTFYKQYGKSLYIQLSYRNAFYKNDSIYSTLCVSVANISQFSIFIKEIGLYAYNDEIKDFEYMWLWCMEPDYDETPIKIMPQESKEFHFEISSIKALISENIRKGIADKKVKIAVKDSTNRLYIKKDVTNKDIKKFLNKI